jgi:hypothetical protein
LSASRDANAATPAAANELRAHPSTEGYEMAASDAQRLSKRRRDRPASTEM